MNLKNGVESTTTVIYEKKVWTQCSLLIQQRLWEGGLDTNAIQ